MARKKYISASIPKDKEERLYWALGKLKSTPEYLLKTNSYLIVDTLIKAAERLEEAERKKAAPSS